MQSEMSSTQEKYKNLEWLKGKYIDERFSTQQIANLAGVSRTTIGNWMKKFNIPRKKICIDKNWLEQKYTNEGLSLSQIAKVLRVSRTTVYNHLKEFNIPRRASPKSNFQLHRQWRNKRWLKQKYVNEKLSSTEICGPIGVSNTTICRWLKEFNIPRRKPSEYRGEKTSGWNGGRFKTTDGYIEIYKPEHPRATKQRYILEHRLVMEEYLGRYLEPSEKVHHLNGIKDDNRIENLELCPDTRSHNRKERLRIRELLKENKKLRNVLEKNDIIY